MESEHPVANSPQQADALRTVVRRGLDQALREFLDAAPALQRELLSKATSSLERNGLRDCGALMRGAEDRIAQRFSAAIDARLKPAQAHAKDAPYEFNVDDLSLQDPSALDRSIMVSRVASRAERQFESVLREIAPRLEQWIYDRDAPFPVDGLSPACLCDCFSEAVETVELDTDQFAAMLTLFETLFIPRLKVVYEAVLTELKSFGLVSASGRQATGRSPGGAAQRARAQQPTGPEESKSESAPPAAEPAGTSGELPPVHPATHPAELAAAEPAGRPGQQSTAPSGESSQDAAASALDPQTLQMLEQVSRQKERPAAYSDDRLAQDLNAIAHGKSVPGWNQASANDSVRRAQAIGRVFNELQANRHISAELKPKFSDMRFAVMKSALADPSFFEDAEHPLRRLLNELSRLAATARVSSQRGAENIGEMLSEIHREFEVAAEAAKPDGDNYKPAEKGDIEKFIKEQRQLNQKRRDELISKSRVLVHEELWLRTAQRDIPASGRRVCAYGWVPMMALKLLRKGAQSKSWTQGLVLLDHMVDGFDPVENQPVAMGPLVDELRQNLQEVGMVDQRIRSILRDLVEALCEGANRPPQAAHAAPPQPDEDELMERLLRKGQWFKLATEQGNGHRWLKSLRHDASTVQFESFDGKVSVLTRTQFLSDIRKGRSEPVDPSPAALQAMELIQAGVKDAVRMPDHDADSGSSEKRLEPDA